MNTHQIKCDQCGKSTQINPPQTLSIHANDGCYINISIPDTQNSISGMCFRLRKDFCGFDCLEAFLAGFKKIRAADQAIKPVSDYEAACQPITLDCVATEGCKSSGEKLEP